MEIHLVSMDRSNVRDVAAIEQECFAEPWSETLLEQELYNDAACYILALDERGVALGYAGLSVVLDEGSIDKVAVKGKYRRMGVADALVDAFVRFGMAHLAFLTLQVRESNAAAIGLYLKHGFAQVGRRKDYYKNPREDAFLMTREFGKRDDK